MAEENPPPAAPPTESNEQAATDAAPAPQTETAVQDHVQPLKGDETQDKSHPAEAKHETLELAGRKKSIEEKKRESMLEARRSTLKERTDSLSSRAKLVLGSIISIKKSDTVGEFGGEKGKSARFMNTYKLDSDRPFNPEKVQKILEEILLEALEGPYDEVKCPLKAKQASAAIRAKIKEMDFDRYKLVCYVTIGEKHNQDVMIACRFLWDVERDRFAMFSHETSHVFGVALCFGLYYE